MGKSDVVIGSARVPATPPDSLPSDARDVWVELVKGLSQVPILDGVDSIALEALSRVVARWRQAEQRIDEDGLFLVHPNGHVYAHPAMKVSKEAKAEFIRWAEKFGLTPRDRVSLGLDVMEAQAMHNRIESKIGPSPRRRGK